MSDITEGEMNVSNSEMELRFEELQKMRNRLKESEDKWQDVSVRSQDFVFINDHECSCLACGSLKVTSPHNVCACASSHTIH